MLLFYPFYPFYPLDSFPHTAFPRPFWPASARARSQDAQSDAEARTPRKKEPSPGSRERASQGRTPRDPASCRRPERGRGDPGNTHTRDHPQQMVGWMTSPRLGTSCTDSEIYADVCTSVSGLGSRFLIQFLRGGADRIGCSPTC